MKLSQVKKLHRGDEVFWNDPDDGACSRQLKILEIEIIGDKMVRIMDEDSSVLECFPRELS